MTMENDLILQNFDEGSDGMLPTTSCSLPSSSGISSLLGATLDNRQPVRLLPRRRLTPAILPIVGRATRATSGSDDMGYSVVGERISEGHGQTIHGKNKSAMPKIILAIRRHCRHLTHMKTLTTITKAEWESMKTISEATKTTGKIKARNGSKYEWVAGGKRITAKKI